MCGIAGRFDASGLAPAPGWHERADRLLAHRGPDAAGHYADDWCELVHRRLALIDLSPSGHQPLGNETGDVQVIYNGEIYNHRHLRQWLEERGHVFRSTSDTEVLVHLYEERGDAMVEDLRGIFAFAIYDRARRRLLLARDRYGVKPLFYAHHGGQVVFASEIKAITALPGFEPQLDRQACWDYLGLCYVPEPATGFANVHALPRASTVAMSASGEHVRSYYNAAALPDPARRLPEVTRELADALLNAVGGQSVADVPVAALLSGGIDSSLIVAAHRRATRERTTTFNVRFPDPRYDETARAVAVAEHLDTRHHVIELGDFQMNADALLDLIRHFDQPFADTSFIPMYWVSRAIREQGIICALSGDGGDEVFGGYGRFWRANRLARLMQYPSWVRTAAVGTGRLLAGVTRDWGRQVAKAAALASAGLKDSAVLISGLSNYLSEEQKIELLVPEARERLLPVHRHFDGYRPLGTASVEELSRRMTERLFSVSLPSDMLRKVDMMSMRASIEVRVPLLDEAVVALGLTLPHHLKTDGHQGKLVLRSLAEQWLPRRVANLPKRGFTIPLDVMTPPGVHAALDDLLLSDRARTAPLLNRGLVRQWLDTFRRADPARRGGAMSRSGLYQRVFMLLSLELWMRDHRLTW